MIILKGEGDRVAQFLKIPFDIIRNKEYLKWAGTSEAKVWQYLASYIVRESNGSGFGNLLHRKYHKNGKLVARWNQKAIAKNIGLSSKGYISDLLNSMIAKGIIKKYTEPWNGKSLNVYEFGTYNKEVGETWHAFTYFKKINGEKTLESFK